MSYTDQSLLGDMKLGDVMNYLEGKIDAGGGGTTVTANPTLAGTEADLTGLQVGDTKYKVGGSGGGVLVVTDTSGTLDKTWQEISDANETGVVVLHNEGVVLYLLGAVNSSGTYMAAFCSLDSLAPVVYSTESASGYPETEK